MKRFFVPFKLVTNKPGQGYVLFLLQELLVPAELNDYIQRLQEQSNRFEQELLECDKLLENSSKKIGKVIILKNSLVSVNGLGVVQMFLQKMAKLD